MKIAITGGYTKADFIISMFKKQNHELIIINDDKEYAKYMSQANDVDVYYGDATKPYILENAGVQGSDILISLCEEDTDNYVICQMGKQMFGVKKCICIVKNPKNVDIFKRLGIECVISSTYLLYKTIESESEVETIAKTLAVENEQIVISEIIIRDEWIVVNKKLKEFNCPITMNVSCILRGLEVIIPDGNTIILPKDKLVVVCKKEDMGKLSDFFQIKVADDAR